MEHCIKEIHTRYQCYFQGCLSGILIPNVFGLIKVAMRIGFYKVTELFMGRVQMANRVALATSKSVLTDAPHPHFIKIIEN
ncbi:transmembrane protein, putative [Medicago truncatula]|uniref:Transmembrane protein, putative n=1 Tax=Medicago truncatula TaxID=3880 RepID=G7J338_MEDTR|nr:transmembrane protein, putative [Medicago truncatula]